MKIKDIVIALVLAVLIFIAGVEYMAYVVEKRRVEADRKALGLKNI